MYRTHLLILVLAAALSAPCAANAAGSSSVAKTSASCKGPLHRQFDFFAGDWDVYDVASPSKVVARNRVTLILGGCVVREDYRRGDGFHGESLSIYDATRKVWHQTWVTNSGTLLLLDGGLKDDRMVLTGSEVDAQGHRQLIEGVWIPLKNGVREIARRSANGGKTWKLWFDIVFRPHGAGHGP